MLSATRVKQLKARLKAEKTPLLYSVVHHHLDGEYHQDTLCVETDKDAAKRFAKRWAKKKEVFYNDENTVWLYEWKKHKVINEWPILVKWKKEH